MDNYCSISLLSNISKLLEKVDIQVSEQKFILPDQHGFIKACSCDIALVNLSPRQFSRCDKGLYSAVAALDFTKTFDIVNYGIILNKLSQLGFDALSRDWFRSYLCDRTRSVGYVGCFSQPL